MERAIAMIVVLRLGACTSTEPSESGASATTPVELRNSSTPGKGVRDDKATGTCSAGAMPFVSRERFEELCAGWSLPAGCKGAAKKEVPGSASFPMRFAESGESGSAQVRVRIEADGTVESAQAICASDSAFAAAAEETARTIAYTPASCDGKPIRNVFLLPFDYH